MTLFATAALAARIDRAEARLCGAIADGIAAREPGLGSFQIPIAGGVAIYAGPGSPTNKMIGLGFDALPSAAELEHVEREFAARGAALQAEVATLADPALHALLARRGYEPRGFENVLGHPLARIDEERPPGVTVERPAPEHMPAWLDAVVDGFVHADSGGVGGDATPPRDELRRWFELTMGVPGFCGYLARREGALAGGASLRLDAGIAQFCGASTLPAHRRRGVQTALLRARLGDASRAGCDVGIVVTQPGSKSQQNVQREGFALLYSRQLFVKMP